jgi:hypothetical protein
MAKIPQGILGGISGKIGGIVGSSWKGINVIKTKPLSVANPQTAGQVAQRSLFGNTVAFAVLILSTIIKPLWDRFASRQSGFNAFIQANISLFAAELPVFGAGFIISKGKMKASVISDVDTQVAATDLAVTIVDDGGEGYKLVSDLPFLVVINQTTGAVTAVAPDFIRSDGQFIVALPSAIVAAETYDVYLAFRRADGTIVSDTASAQKVVA